MLSEWITAMRLRLKALFHRRQLDRDLNEELQFHLAMRQQKLVEEGMTPNARYSARRAFGNTTQAKESNREVWAFPLVERLWQDLRYAFRQLRRNLGFTVVVVLTLALGISVNAVVFSALDATLWRPLPVSKPAELTLVQMVDKRTGRVVGIPPSLLPELQDDNQAFSGVTATVADGVSFRRRADGAGSRVICETVTANYYDTLGVRPYLGRFFAPGSDRGDWQPVLVLSYSFFKSQFGADPGIVGKTIYLNTYPFTVIGVEPPGFFGTEVGSSWQVRVPMMLQPGMQHQRMPAMELLDPTNESSVWPIARLKSGVTRRQAETVTDALLQRLLRSNAFASESRRLRNLRIQLKDGKHGSLSLVGELSMPLSVLMCLGGLVLLITCVTAANLLLIRATVKQREIGLRKALGASRKDLIQSSLMEGALLASFGCVAGIAFAYWGSHLVVSFLPRGNVPVVMDLTPDFRVLAFALIISGVIAIVMGSVPSLRIDEAMVMPVLKGNTLWTRSGERVRFETGSLPVVSQIALSVVVLILAVMFLRTVRNLEAVRVGFNTDNLLLLSLKPIQDGSVRDTRRVLCGSKSDGEEKAKPDRSLAIKTGQLDML